MMGDGFQRVTRSGKAKRTSKLRSGGGIKAVITVGDLQSVVAAAKKWQAHCVEGGEPASKLLHHIANAEAVLLKYRTRNKLAYEEREKRRRAEAERQGEPLPPPHDTNNPNEEPRFGTKVWNVLDALGVRKKAEEGASQPEARKEAARPTRW